MMLINLLKEAVSTATDMAVGNDGIEAVLVALPDHRPPVTMFVEADDCEASRRVAQTERQAFLQRTGATRWVAIEAARIAPGGEALVCTATVDGRSLVAVLVITRDASGVIAAVAELPSMPVAFPATCLQ